MRAWLLVGGVALDFGLASSGCQRADLYAVTEEADAGGGDIDAASAGCSASALPAGNTNVALQMGSLSRTFVLHIPASYTGARSVPLIVDFHGIGSSGASELSSSPYLVAADPEGVIMAFPDGTKGPVGTAWDVGPCCVADVDDLGFAKALVAHVETIACIDATRIYAVGVLTGGGMAYHLACHAAEVFAAVAPAAFDLVEENAAGCAPARPITVISFRGTADTRVPYAGGATALVPGMPITFLGAKATFARWAQIDGCTGVEVILCSKPGGREEPGDAAIAWPVLKRHAL